MSSTGMVEAIALGGIKYGVNVAIGAGIGFLFGWAGGKLFCASKALQSGGVGAAAMAVDILFHLTVENVVLVSFGRNPSPGVVFKAHLVKGCGSVVISVAAIAALFSLGIIGPVGIGVLLAFTAANALILLILAANEYRQKKQSYSLA